MSKSDDKTSGGVELTEELIERLAAEAERGYDVERLRPRPRRGRPPMGADTAVVFQVRLEPELHEALLAFAESRQSTPSELMRQALRAYLEGVQKPGAANPGHDLRVAADRDDSPEAVDSAVSGDVASSPAREFAQALGELRRTAGFSLRQIAERGGLATSTVSAALSGRILPTWRVTSEIVRACDGNRTEWQARWETAKRAAVRRGTSDMAAVNSTKALMVSSFNEFDFSRAVRLLGRDDDRIVRAMDAVTGGLTLAPTGSVSALLGWLDAKIEFGRLARRLLDGLTEHPGRLSRLDRTNVAQAAHAVIVVVAYFDALAEIDLPFRLADLQLSGSERIATVGSAASMTDGSALLDALRRNSPGLIPTPDLSYEDHLRLLDGHYLEVCTLLRRFVSGLSAWARSSQPERHQFDVALDATPARASHYYEQYITRLAADFPEVAFWTWRQDLLAASAAQRRLGTASDTHYQMLVDLSARRRVDGRRSALARIYAADLDRPALGFEGRPDWLDLPTLRAAYVSPPFRVVSDRMAGGQVNYEAQWAELPVREDLEGFLAGYLTGSAAQHAPLLILGDPGSGKSTLARFLAGQLPSADFVPIRVALRDSPVNSSLERQIEHAIREATGEQLAWTALARSADGALPVILLDGLDELVQSTGSSQSDFLIEVADFQRRQADQGRPIAVLLTSRTAIADRIRKPEGSTVLRLESFDRQRVEHWLRVWNASIGDQLADRGLPHLTADMALADPQVGRQPLLLSMFAISYASGNMAQHHDPVDRVELYERFLEALIRRDMASYRADASHQGTDADVEQELHRLSMVAFAMFNRGQQWISGTELANDLDALDGPTFTARDERPLLNSAATWLHRSVFEYPRGIAARGETRPQTFEFLHATLGEFLVARETSLIVRDIGGVQAEAAATSRARTWSDDDRLDALLSFTPFTSRAPVVDFLTQSIGRLSHRERHTATQLLLRRFQRTLDAHLPRGFDAYNPRRNPAPMRLAAYSANLLTLIVCITGGIAADELYGDQPDDAIRHWNSHKLLWRSQLPPGWQSPADMYALHRLPGDNVRGARLYINWATPGSAVVRQTALLH